jgi:hypothetical protein
MVSDVTALPWAHLQEHWDAQRYLKDYYAFPYVPDDDALMFGFVARGLRAIGRTWEAGIEVGCGPVLHHAAQLVPWVHRLDMADFQESNLEEIRRWIQQLPGAHDWSALIAGRGGVLDAEEGRGGTLAERESLMRDRIRTVHCDIESPQPLPAPARYGLVASFYSMEWVRPTRAGWEANMKNLASLLEEGGWLLLVGVHETDFCRMGETRIPSAHLRGEDIRALLLRLGFDEPTIRLEVIPGRDPGFTGIHGTFLCFAQKGTRSTDTQPGERTGQ